MKPVNFGIIGCGVIGTMHIKSAASSDEVRIGAVADIRAEVAQTVAAEYSIDKVYTDAEQLLADPDIEAVVLAMPAHIRTQLALRVFAQGKHLLTEKPVAMNTAEVKTLIAAQGTLLAGCCSSRFHFLEATKVVTDFIASGVLGQLRVIRCRAIRPAGPPPANMPPNWRLSKELNGGGIMSNWGCYDLDYLLGITGWTLQPKTVLGQTWTVPGLLAGQVTPNSNAETHLTALIRCESGCVITYERGEYVAATADEAWEIIGEQGALQLKMTPGENKVIYHHDTNLDRGVASSIIWQGNDSYNSLHSGPMADFARAIRTATSPQTNLERALIIQQITDAIYRSAEENTAIDLDDL
jgi:predicted dehydrogenase